MLVTNGLAYRYSSAGAVFRFPDLDVDVDGPTLLLGPSGAGKSTWLHLLAGVLTPLSGSVRLDDTEYSTLRGGALDRFRGRHIGLVFQRAYFLDALTVVENLAMARKIAGLPADGSLLRETLGQLGIDQFAHERPGNLSVGERQRVTIARALVNQPTLILADEPTSALDNRNAARVSGLLRERAASLGAILIVVTHDERLRGDFPQVVTLDHSVAAN